MRLRPQYLRFARACTAGERAELRRLLRIMQLDPAPDNIHKIVLPMLPLVFTVYVTEQFWLVYHVDGTQITVFNIGRPPSNPRPW